MTNGHMSGVLNLHNTPILLLLLQRHGGTSIFSLVMEIQVHHEDQSFWMVLLSDSLNTRNMLKRRHYNIGDDHDCILCGMRIEETIEHLFFECQFSQICWASLGFSWQQGGTRLEHIEVAKETWARPLFMEAFLIAAWSIWKERNNKHFQRYSTIQGLLAKKIQRGLLSPNL
ncbi:unnamed protein product [Triticum turgidum subsp. durum]|uniref:Reverse transcriptase zinc-binding domain-containing protein n=1 Tax=Triticum turgidum subsp. durum TaxID=4567 RepID=A0A9R1QQA5_TRITD|nr:unnamed protein product [Triticum turgidum subsp. durum]